MNAATSCIVKFQKSSLWTASVTRLRYCGERAGLVVDVPLGAKLAPSVFSMFFPDCRLALVLVMLILSAIGVYIRLATPAVGLRAE